jgi:hypothetical protein
MLKTACLSLQGTLPVLPGVHSFVHWDTRSLKGRVAAVRMAGRESEMHLFQEGARFGNGAAGLLQARNGAPEWHAVHATLEAVQVGGARGLCTALPLLQLAQHQVQLVEAREFLYALLQQLPLLHEAESRPLNTPRISCATGSASTPVADQQTV